MSNLDLAQLTELKDIMEDAFGELVNTYLDDSSAKLDSLEQAVSDQDAEAVASLAHSIKGASSNICAPGLADKFKVLEDMGRAGDVAGASTAFEEAKASYQSVKEELLAL